MRLIKLLVTELKGMSPWKLICTCGILVGLVFVYILLMNSTLDKPQVDKPPRNTSSSSPVMKGNRSFSDAKVSSKERIKIDGSAQVDKRARFAPDKLLLGKSLQELDALHERQMREIQQEALDAKNEIRLPPSDDPQPSMTLEELDAFHQKQHLEIQSHLNESGQLVLPPSDDGDLHISVQELEAMHEEQAVHSQSDDDLVKLPPVSAENEAPVLTIDELTYMQEDQEFEAQISEVNDTEPIVLPPSADGPYAITNWDLIELHRKQDQVIRQRYGR